MKKILKSVLCLSIAAVLFGGVAAVSGCGNRRDENTFQWFIPKNDGAGTYYSTYDQSMPVQWLNNQYWDSSTGGLGTAESGSQITLTFFEAVSGSEDDSLSTMIGSGDYSEIIDLTYSTQSPQQLVEEGVLMEITEYVEAYMPNYVNFLNENPDVKQLTTVTDENGEVHYYALYGVADERNDNFMGYIYRRDWVVDYADVPTHVWDRENVLTDPDDPTSVDTSKIHYTDYYEAMAHNDWTGWIEQTEITAFTSSDGPNNDPDNDWTDNVIFPSGTSEPIYITDWEWMFRAFSKAIAAEGFAGDDNAYCTTVYYEGALGTGDLYSSFGGGNPWWYYTSNENGNVAQFGGDSDTMRNYLEAMNNWYNNGWLDSSFQERTDGLFYRINTTGFGQGKVGLGQMAMAYIGDTIRATADNQKAFCMGCTLPINDKYGTADQKFIIPDSMYSATKISSPTGFSTACEGKNLEALFTMLNWMYSEEGFRLATYGLNEEQLASMEFENNYYEEYGITSAYYQDENGLYYYAEETNNDITFQGALCGQRIATFISLNSQKGNSYSWVIRYSLDCWREYDNNTDVTVYNSFMTSDESSTYNNRLTQVRDYMDANLPSLIKNGVTDDSWSSYANMVRRYGYSTVNDIYNAVFQRLGIYGG